MSKNFEEFFSKYIDTSVIDLNILNSDINKIEINKIKKSVVIEIRSNEAIDSKFIEEAENTILNSKLGFETVSIKPSFVNLDINEKVIKNLISDLFKENTSIHNILKDLSLDINNEENILNLQ